MPSSTTDFFPAKLALGKQFCNRQAERKLLSENVAKTRHTVLVSPRRYGKSSLVHQVIAELKLPSASVDLFLAHDDQTVTKRILRGISEALSLIMPPSEKLLDKVQALFRSFKITFSASLFNIEATYQHHLDPVDQIFEALRSLAKLAKEQSQKIIFFIDEFQDLANAQSAKSIQGALRHVAQETSEIVFIFSGSNRHLLLDLFDDSNMPLYMLCDKLPLDRIASKDYEPYLQQVAKKKWQAELSEYTLTQILKVTELHPFYVNMLCNQLWRLDALPSEDEVKIAWEYCYELEKRRLVAELEKLTTNQQDLLKALALNPIIESTGQKFINTTGLAASSIRQGITALSEKDMIYTVAQEDLSLPALKQGQIRVLDPLLAFALRKYS